ncbi:hypothetical protein Bbelb_157120 [Branchiostoma belcheri]|nr:hypothetical protein Bbelb_157120 [Branchiostoma belcheri]
MKENGNPSHEGLKRPPTSGHYNHPPTETGGSTGFLQPLLTESPERRFCNDADRTSGPRALLFQSYTGELAAIVVQSRLFYQVNDLLADAPLPAYLGRMPTWSRQRRTTGGYVVLRKLLTGRSQKGACMSLFHPHGKPPRAGHTYSVRPSGNGKLTAVATGEAERVRLTRTLCTSEWSPHCQHLLHGRAGSVPTTGTGDQALLRRRLGQVEQFSSLYQASGGG